VVQNISSPDDISTNVLVVWVSFLQGKALGITAFWALSNFGKLSELWAFAKKTSSSLLRLELLRPVSLR
jgi:hypothetical protein